MVLAQFNKRRCCIQLYMYLRYSVFLVLAHGAVIQASVTHLVVSLACSCEEDQAPCCGAHDAGGSRHVGPYTSRACEWYVGG